MKQVLLFAAIAGLILTPLARSEDTEKLAYPDSDHASFTLEVPTEWKLKQAESEGDYFHLHGPTGAVFSFRTIEGDKDSLDEAMKDSIKQLHKKYSDVNLGDAKDWNPNGLSGFYATGDAKEDDGNPVRIAMGWCSLADGKIAEFWFVTDIKDSEGMDDANKIANSLSAPE